jgi:carboxymethylenebutenolidase
MANSQPSGYLAHPPSGKGPGILILHAWWGLSDSIKEVCDRLAAEGFIAFAPDLYHGKLTRTIEQAEILASQLDPEGAESDINQAVDFLRRIVSPDQHGLGVVGFSLGAHLGLQLSADDPQNVRALVVFYGTGSFDFSQSKAAYMGHFAEIDPYEPSEAVDHLEGQLRAAGLQVAFYRYQGVGHWFFERDQPEAYRDAEARLAWQRTLAFLKEAMAS